ncbi:helix-turn-helix domain-containing protein [Pleomorphomonas sp. JP5]|uniref:helix-turn-helix domain-containing protein n=1 Tax=Pleomorphomonas sp. JP5 TaxID=2942998 RepID=UPI0020434863|nr:helix-turn-helix domain-containing protein [Pleomorphomonas sp. JP5]MCM5557374.1 AraC family transcriptional regulator [Pleomorphomonas sp. JP5]
MAGEVHHGRDGTGAVETVRVDGAVAETPMHAHLSLILGLVDAGTRHIVLPDGPHRLEPGDGFVIPPDTAHAFAASAEGSHRVVALSPGNLPPWRAAIIRDSSWRTAFDALFDAAESGRPNATDLVPALLMETDRLAPRTAQPGPMPRPLRAARRLAGERLDEDVDLRALGRLAGLSPFHLHRLYRRAYGLTPAEHRLEARLRLARRLILSGVAIAEAAATAGFADQSHLTRAFRKLMGTSPGRWAREMRR